MLTGNPFRTNAEGQIIIPELSAGVYRITETRAANNYWLDPQVVNRTWTITIRENEDYLLIVENTLLPTLVITKRNAVTWRPIPMTQFRVDFEVPNSQNLQHIGYFMTNAQGQIILPFVQSGWYQITETRPAPGMTLATNNRFRVFLQPGQNSYTLIQEGIIASESMITPSTITPPQTGDEPIFEDDESYTEYLPNGNQNVENAPTPDVPPGIDIEIHEPDIDAITDGGLAPEQYNPTNSSSLPDDSRVQIGNGDQFWNSSLDVWNFPQSSIVIRKENSVTGQLLQGATFSVTRVSSGNDSGQAGTIIGHFTTNHSGILVISGLDPGYFVIEETNPPPNFTLSLNSRQHVFLRPDDTSVVELTFSNDPYGSLLLSKSCSVTGVPLQNAEFRVVNSSGAVVGTANGLFRTNAQGEVLIPNLPPDSYVVTETRAPNGFILDSTPQTIRVNATGNTYRLEFTNTPESSVIIRKVSGFDRSPLAGARFTVQHQNGGTVGEFTTNASGVIEVPNLLGWVIVTETHPPTGYTLSANNSRTVEVRPGSPVILEFVNERIPGLTIEKVDENGRALAGAEFEIRRPDGSLAGRQVTNRAGVAIFPGLEPGVFIITEVRAPEGYMIIEGPRTIELRAGENRVERFVNPKLPSIVIRKICGDTGRPLAGVVFEFARYLANGQTGQRLKNYAVDNSYEFVTDASGHIYLPTLEHGTWIAIETRPLPGFMAAQPVTFRVGQNGDHTIIIRNYRYPEASGLLIVKTCAQTDRPLQGVEFEIRHADGRLVRNAITDENQSGTHASSPQLTATGGFVTDARGRIQLNHLPAGVFHITETRALEGFELDTTVHVATLVPGEQTVLRVTNRPLGGIRLFKYCAFTGQGLFNVEFMVFDHRNQVVGVFYTDNTGIIDFSGILVQGRYTIRETRPAPGYIRDDVPRTIEIIPGQVTEIRWSNTPYAGQLQIQKISGDWNEINGLPPNTPLPGAIFEIFDERTGNLVDRIISDHRGMAVSRPLPIGRYFAQEVQAPQFYMLNPTPLHFQIEHPNQIVRATFPNFSSNLGVNIDKVGPREVLQGQEIVYEIRNIRNESAVPLSDFFWRDILPTEAIRAQRLVMGTFNHSVRYSIHGRTNMGNEFIIADNLLSTRNTVVELGPAHLGLAHGEYLVQFSVIFGQVPPGFMSIEHPRLVATVLSEQQANLPNGMIFVNRVDVGGRHGEEWVISNDTWGTTLIVLRRNIPQSGW